MRYLTVPLLLIIAGMLLAGAGVWTATLATADPLRTRGWLIAVSAVLVAIGTAAILFGIARMVERFA